MLASLGFRNRGDMRNFTSFGSVVWAPLTPEPNLVRPDGCLQYPQNFNDRRRACDSGRSFFVYEKAKRPRLPPGIISLVTEKRCHLFRLTHSGDIRDSRISSNSSQPTAVWRVRFSVNPFSTCIGLPWICGERLVGAQTAIASILQFSRSSNVLSSRPAQSPR